MPHTITEYVSNPFVTILYEDGEISALVHYFSLKIELEKEALEIWEYCEESRSINEIELNFPNVELRLYLEEMVRNFILFDTVEFEDLQYGLLKDCDSPIGERVKINEIFDIKDSHGIVGVPFDFLSDSGGARKGPAQIRHAFKKYHDKIIQGRNSGRELLHDFERGLVLDTKSINYRDFGNVECSLGEGIQIIGFRIRKLINMMFNNGVTPIILGGDHSITLFHLQSVQQSFGDFGLIQFDAHHDIYMNSFLARNHLNNGNFLGMALRDQGLKKVYQFGVRTIDYISEYSLRSFDDRVITFSGFQMCTDQSLFENLRLTPGLPYFLTLDLDCLCPSVVSNVGNPVVGGIDYYTLFKYLSKLFNEYRIVGIDFVELSPRPNQEINIGAEIIARIMMLFLSANDN